MKALILGEADSIWMYEYLDKVYKNKGDDDYFLIVSSNNSKFRDYWQKKGIIVRTYGDALNNHNRIDVIQILKKLSEDITKTEGDFDLIHIHYLNIYNYILFYYLMKLADRRVLTFWGSDLLRANSVYLFMYRCIFKNVDYIHLLTENMRKFFVDKYGEQYEKKVVTFDFGCPMYGMIDEIKKHFSVPECRDCFGIAEDRIVVAVGYNGNPEQQHIYLIEALNELDDCYREKIQIVLHFGYGVKNEEYQKKVLSRIKETGMEYVLIDTFLSREDLSKLRIAVDIFLYGQTTDSLAASLVEYVYAGAICVKGSWLEYPDLEKREVKIYDFDKFNDLTLIIKHIIDEGIGNIKKELLDNKQKVWEFNSWEILLPKWIELDSNVLVN